MKSLKERTVQGGLAKVGAQAAAFSLRIGALVILARLLDPKDFGLVAMVAAVTGIFDKFRDMGLSVVTIQRPTITNDQLSTLFWTNMLVGSILGLLTLVSAPLLVSFYDDSRLFWVTVALATGFLFSAAGVQHSALLQRQMRFVALATIEVVSALVSTGAGILMAVYGYEYWALVAMAITLPGASTVCLWLSAAWIPGAPHRGVELGSMIRLGSIATLNAIVIYVAYNLDKVLLGRVWGPEVLGIYGRAYQLINFPMDGLTSAVGGVAFSVLSRLHDDPARLKSYFLKGYSLVLTMTLPLAVVCALLADDIVSVVLGAKWADAAIIFRFLTPTILIFALINPTGWMLYSTGRASRSLKISLAIAPLVMGAYVLGLPYGANGVAFAYSAAMTLWLVPHIVWSLHGTTISGRDILRAASHPLVSALAAAAITVGALHFLGESSASFSRLALGTTVFLVTYLWILLYVMGQKGLYFGLLHGLKGGLQRS